LKDESATTCPSKGWSFHGIVMEDMGTAIRVLNAVTDIMSNVKTKTKLKTKHSNKRSRRNPINNNKDSSNVSNGSDQPDCAQDVTVEDSNDSSSLWDAYREDPQLRPLRKALAQCFHLYQQTTMNDQSQQEFYQGKLHQQTIKRQKLAESHMQRKHIANTLLRKGRTALSI
jgi:hypothetical protein